MAKQEINIGTMADNKSGDTLRAAFTKINENFTELYNADQQVPPSLSIAYGEDQFDQVSLLFLEGNMMVYEPEPGIVVVSQPEYASTDYVANAISSAPSRTGEVTFSGNTVIGKSLTQVGSIITVNTDYNGNQPGTNGTGVQVPADTPGINQTTSGWVITLATGHRVPLIASYYWADGNFWVLQWDQNYSSSNPVYPLTVESPDYQAGEPAALTLKASTNATGEVKLNDDGSVTFPDSSTQSSAALALSDLKTIVAASSDFSDFQTRIANL